MAGDTPKPALISVRNTTEESKWAGQVCPKCSKPIEPGQQAVLCPKCYTPQHRDCWVDNGNKCAIDGTPANILDRSAPRAAAGTAAAAHPATAPRPTPAPPGNGRAPAAARPAAARPAAAPPAAGAAAG